MNSDSCKMPRAVILAGGKGTRLKPFTASFPKPLVPIGDIPVLEVLLQKLIYSGITDVTLTLGHLAELVQAYISQRAALMEQLNITYVREAEPTGTAGSLSLVEGLDQTFFALNGDLMTNLSLRRMLRAHQASGAVLTIATHAIESQCEFGVLAMDQDGTITEYIEKPKSRNMVSMGIYLYEPEVLRYIPAGEYLDFPTLVNRLLRAGRKVAGYHEPCTWLDIGRPDDYAMAQKAYEEKSIGFFTQDAPSP